MDWEAEGASRPTKGIKDRVAVRHECYPHNKTPPSFQSRRSSGALIYSFTLSFGQNAKKSDPLNTSNARAFVNGRHLTAQKHAKAADNDKTQTRKSRTYLSDLVNHQTTFRHTQADSRSSCTCAAVGGWRLTVLSAVWSAGCTS